MDFTDNILIAIPTIIIALSSLVVVWSQRVDSRQQALIGAITLLINLKDKEVSTLSTLMETASRPDLIKNLPDKARKNAFLDAKKTLERLDSLDSSYNNLIAKLDNELKQSGSLAKALTLSKDSNPETTLDIFKKAFKV